VQVTGLKRTRFKTSIFALIVVVAGVSSVITWSLTSQSRSKTMSKIIHPCSGNSLSSFENHQGAGGSIYVSVIFLNTSKSQCSLTGFPVVTLYNAKGYPMTNEPQKDAPWIPLRRVIVSNGGEAGFVIQFADGAVPGVDPPQGCRAAASMQLKLPHVFQNGQPYTTSFTMDLAPCDGGGFEVTAIQKGEPMP
jgi:hypothetical protein